MENYEAIKENRHPEQEMKKIPIILMILFFIITVGLYLPYWYISRSKILNQFNSSKKINTAPLIITSILIAIDLTITYVPQAVLLLNQYILSDNLSMNLLELAIQLSYTIILYIQAFKIRDIILEHFDNSDDMGIDISWGGVFGFREFYLQYKINRFPKPLDMDEI